LWSRCRSTKDELQTYPEEVHQDYFAIAFSARRFGRAGRHLCHVRVHGMACWESSAPEYKDKVADWLAQIERGRSKRRLHLVQERLNRAGGEGAQPQFA